MVMAASDCLLLLAWPLPLADTDKDRRCQPAASGFPQEARPRGGVQGGTRGENENHNNVFRVFLDCRLCISAVAWPG